MQPLDEAVGRERRPVIGFRLQTGDFMGRRAFRTFEPLYDLGV